MSNAKTTSNAKIMSNAKKIQDIVESALESGSMSEAEHEWILKEIHKDGTIDAEESAVLSSLFRATKNGQLIIGSKPNSSPSHELDARKREAIDRFAQQEEKKILNSHSSNSQIPNSETSVSQDSATKSIETIGGDSISNSFTESSKNTSNYNSPSFEELFDSACQPRNEGPEFALQNERLLDARLEGKLWMKTGAMVGYYGNITFTREGISEHGLKKLVKKAITGEGTSLTKAIGSGNLYLADQGKKISVIDLRGQSLTVNGHSILAFQDCIDWDITFLKQVAAMITGGFFQVRLCGMGVVAITTHFDPIVLKVSAANPVMTDYNATVAWSSGVTPSLKTDVSMQTMIGRGSGESVQLAFHGDGFVVIQPFEEISPSQES